MRVSELISLVESTLDPQFQANPRVCGVDPWSVCPEITPMTYSIFYKYNMCLIQLQFTHSIIITDSFLLKGRTVIHKNISFKILLLRGFKEYLGRNVLFHNILKKAKWAEFY